MKGARVSRRWFLALLAGPALARAQGTNLRRVGVIANHVPRAHLELGEASPFPGSAQFTAGLRQLGWENGRNLRVFWRSAEGQARNYPPIVSELVRMPVDVIVGGDEAVVASAKATRSVPIVAYSIDRPVESGYAESLARPGRNLTGISNSGHVELQKPLQILKESCPGLRRVGLVTAEAAEHADAYPVLSAKSPLMLGASALRIELRILTFGNARSLPELVASAARQGIDALMVDGTYAIHYHPESREAVHQAAIRHRLPVMHLSLVAAGDGGLMAYGYDLTEQWRRASYFVDRILRGAKPGELPIEYIQIRKFHVNLKAARAIGLEIPPAVLLQADRVFE